MPKFPKEQIYGLQRTFVMYVKFPKTRWKEIERAEKNDAEGNKIYKELKMKKR